MITNIFKSRDLDTDIENFLACEAKAEESLPHCCCCQEPIYSDKAWHIGDDWYCDDCEDEAIAVLADEYKASVYYGW